MAEINAQTGEPQSASGWSQDDPANAAPGAAALAQPSPLAAAASKYTTRLDALAEDEQKEFKAGQDAQAPYRDKLLKMLDSPQAANAHLEKVKEQPKPEDYQKYSMEFASAFAVMGALAGKFTRAGGTAALNAFSGALKGWQQGNLQAYESAAKEWEQSAKKTLENNNIELEKYKEIMADKKANIDQMMAAMNIVAAEHQNKILFDATLEKNYTMAFSAVDKMTNAQAKAQGAVDKLTGLRGDQAAVIKSKVDTLNAHPEMLSQMTSQQYLQLKGAAEALGLKLNDPAQGVTFAGGGQPRSAPAMALRKYIQENPEATSEQIAQFAAHYGGEQKATRDFSTGKQGDAIKSFSVALDHLDVADQLGHALQNGDTQSLNQMRNLAKQQFGWEGAVDFNFAKKIVGDEITKSILGSGAGTGQDREDIQKAFSSANSPAQLEGVIKTAKRLMAGQLHGLKQQYEQTTRQTDFDTRLSPAARRELEGLTPATDTAAGGTTGKTSTGVEYTIH
jgi:hypothetical protein